MEWHLREEGRTHKTNWIRSLLKIGLKPTIVIIQEVGSKEELPEMEKQAIAKYKAEGHRLTNSTDGGEGCFGRRCSTAAKTKISKANSGRKHTDLTKKKIGKAISALFATEEMKVKLARTHGGRQLLEITTGRIFPSQCEAARTLGLLQGNVAAVLNGRYSNTGGFVFRYVGG